MGLIIFAAIGLYLLISFGVVKGAINHARNQGKSVKRWGWGAVLVIYLIPFWDWIPTVATHQYYCATEAGFWVYKTPEQWKKENPGVMATLMATDIWRHQKVDGKDVDTINERMNLVHAKQDELFLHRWPDIRELVDVKTHEVLARYVGFSTSQERGGAGWSGWKFWLHSA